MFKAECTQYHKFRKCLYSFHVKQKQILIYEFWDVLVLNFSSASVSLEPSWLLRDNIMIEGERERK